MQEAENKAQELIEKFLYIRNTYTFMLKNRNSKTI
jgi:hypothetical protein